MKLLKILAAAATLAMASGQEDGAADPQEALLKQLQQSVTGMATACPSAAVSCGTAEAKDKATLKASVKCMLKAEPENEVCGDFLAGIKGAKGTAKEQAKEHMNDIKSKTKTDENMAFVRKNLEENCPVQYASCVSHTDNSEFMTCMKEVPLGEAPDEGTTAECFAAMTLIRTDKASMRENFKNFQKQIKEEVKNAKKAEL